MKRKLSMGETVYFNWLPGMGLNPQRSEARVIGLPTRRGPKGSYVRIRLLDSGEQFQCHPDRLTVRGPR